MATAADAYVITAASIFAARRAWSIVGSSPMIRSFSPFLSGSTPRRSNTIIVCNQNPPPMLWTPTIFSRRAAGDSISLRTISSRAIRLKGAATQPIFAPPETPLRTEETAVQKAWTSPDIKAVRLTWPLRTWRMLTSRPDFLKNPLSAATHRGPTVSLCPP